MDEKTPSRKSRTKSSAAASKAGSEVAATVPAAKPAARAGAAAKPSRARTAVRAGAPVDALELLRAACSVRVVVEPPGESALLLWGQRRLAAAGSQAEPGALEALLETCEHDALAFLNEVGKLAVLSGPERRVTRAHVQAL